MHLELTFKPVITIALYMIFRMLFLTALRFFIFFPGMFILPVFSLSLKFSSSVWQFAVAIVGISVTDQAITREIDRMSHHRTGGLPAFCTALIKSEGDCRRLGQFAVGETIYADRSRVVFRSEDPLTERAILIAVFAGREVPAEQARAKLLPGHDFLYPVHELVETADAPVMILPVLNGTSLRDLLAGTTQLPLPQALRIAREVLLALAVGQERGLLHGTIDSEWVWVEPGTGHCRLIGLGWRMLEPAGTGELADFLASGSSKVPAPEVTEGKSPGAAADLFGVGMLLYQMITGRPAYKGNSPLEIIKALAMGEPESPGGSASGIPVEVASFIMKLLARSVENRPASAMDAAREIKELEKSLNATLSPSQATAKKPANSMVSMPEVMPEEIGLVPIDEKPVVKVVNQTEPLSLTEPEEDENSLIDFYTPPTGHASGKGAQAGQNVRPVTSAGDDMLIELLPIDDEPQPMAGKATKGPAEAAKVKMSLELGSSYTGLKVPLEWVFVADSPIEAVHLAGESQQMMVRDQSGRVQVISLEGEILAKDVAPDIVRMSAADQAGELAVMVLGKRKLAFFDWDLNLVVEKTLHSEPVAVAVDALGLYVAVSFPSKETWIYTRDGKKIATFDTRQPLSKMAFVTGSSRLVGATTFDQVVCAEISKDKSGYYDAELIWQQNVGVGVGHLHVIGGNGKVLASCNNMGLQRLDVDGENEGTYQLGGTVIESAADFPGRFFMASTLEGSLLAVNSNGSVMWEHARGGPWRQLTVDPLGRYALAASAVGELVCMDLSKELKGRADHAAVRVIGASGGIGATTVKGPEWSLRVADPNDDLSSYSLCVVEKPFRACVLDGKKRLTCFTQAGDEAETLAGMGGGGRMLKAEEGWVAVGSGQSVRLLNLATQQVVEPDLSLVQVTHFQMRPRNYGLLIIQEADRLGRASMDGRWLWRVHLPATVESLVLTEDGYAAVSLDNSQVGVVGPAGKGVGKWSAGEQEAVLLCESQARHDGLCRWVSLARNERVLRGHALDMRLLWQVEVPFAPWDLLRTTEGIVVSANDNSAIMYDDSGEIVARRRGGPRAVQYASDKKGITIALHYDQGILFCTKFDGSVIWRVPMESEPSTTYLSASGALVLAEGVLSWIAGE